MKIAIFRWGIFLAMLTGMLAALPPVAPPGTTIEIMSKSQRSVSARFRPIAGVKKYSVSIRRKYLADARADAVMSFNENDLNSDGYYYINLKKKLKAGQLYEISVYHGRREITGNVDFFTTCPKSKYQCMSDGGYGEICLTTKQLCDGEKNCQSGEDEMKNNYGKCIAFQRPPVLPVPLAPAEPPAPPVPAVPTTLPTTVIEILSKSQKSVSARFRPLPGVKKYTINVYVKFLADVGADYWVKLNADEDLAPDGYFYVNAANKLKPGELYEFAAFYGSLETAGSVDFFTDCYDYEFQCLTDTVLGQTCLERKQLCDGIADCTGGIDEKKDARGKCSAVIQKNSSPPAFLPVTNVEIVSVSQRSVSARFLPLPGVKKYRINVVIKYLADVSADYWTDVKEKDLASDGYHYVYVVNVLKPGTLYEFIVFYGSLETAGMADFFTDCQKSMFQCKSYEDVMGMCLEQKKVCDGTNDCPAGDDEKQCIPESPAILSNPSNTKTNVEILSKGKRSVSARFRPLPGIKKYRINVFLKYLADSRADFWAKLDEDDLSPDGYYYVNAVDKLKPGKLYEFAVYYGSLETAGTADFFTDCISSTFQCKIDGARTQTCLEQKYLCDGTRDCLGGEDEEKDSYGKCLAKIPLFSPAHSSPLPPPPPLPSKTNVEILSKSMSSVRARFQPLQGVSRYLISIGKKYLTDAPADYWVRLNESDLDADGYYYVDANNKLTPGQLYELSVIYGSSETAGTVDFFTDCETTKFQCTYDGARQQICLEQEQLCDGTFDCQDKRDEEKDYAGKCKASAQGGRKTQCMKQMAIATAAKRTDHPACDKDGNFPALHCEYKLGYSCFCLDKYSGKKLMTQYDYNPLVHYTYLIDCVLLRKKASE